MVFDIPNHQEKCSEIIINCKEVMKTTMTTICCNQLGAVDTSYNPIIIKSQPSKYMITNANFPVIALVIITLESECELLMSRV